MVAPVLILGHGFPQVCGGLDGHSAQFPCDQQSQQLSFPAHIPGPPPAANSHTQGAYLGFLPPSPELGLPENRSHDPSGPEFIPGGEPLV